MVIVTSVTSEIVGRENELRSLASFLEREPRGPVALVLEGEAGIGKSTLWFAAVENARERGFRVLVSRPAETERSLAFAGLGDLFESVLEDVVDELPPPRRRALEAALLVGDSPEPADVRALGVAVRNALEILAGAGRLVVAVDDVQWLDRTTAATLTFALRRMEGSVVLLLARRVDESTSASELEHALPAGAVERLSVGPLSVGAVQVLLRDRLGRVFARPTLLRIHEASGGNPFYAIELARALPADVDPTRPLPVPETLDGLIRVRLAGLPQTTQDALVLVSALGSPPLKLLAEAGVREDDLDPAFEARVLERENGSVRFTHPLLASVLYLGRSGKERRRAHRFLAGVVTDPIERSRHLALATDTPDADVSATLERAAEVARARGATLVAAELGAHSVRLTPVAAVEDEHRRTMAAGRAHMAAGEIERARTLGDALAEKSPEGVTHAEVLMYLSELESARLQDKVELRRQALREEDLPDELRQRIHQRVALDLRFLEGRSPAVEHARAAVELADRLDDDRRRAGALAVLALLDFQGGEPGSIRLAEYAVQLAEAAGDVPPPNDPGFCLAHTLVWSYDVARARQLLSDMVRTWQERDERVTAQALWYLSLVELSAGRFQLATEHAERARGIGMLYGRDEEEEPQNVFPITLALAHRGRLDEARAAAELGIRLTEKLDVLLPGFPAARGLVAAWEGAEAEAEKRFASAEEIADRAGWVEPGLRWWRSAYTETLVALEMTDEATALLDDWDAGATRLDRTRVLAQVARGRGLVAAVRGDVDEALALLADAVKAHEAAGDPFGRAQALLALGTVRRRGRKKRLARDALVDALAGFEECGAEGWAARARSELGGVGGRRRQEGLTPAEQRVAELVAEGRTNREVAATLVLGERTVETHLTHIYAKLGIRSRTELARTLDMSA
jgi:DNA-binding NarL/FixJ family response regulator